MTQSTTPDLRGIEKFVYGLGKEYTKESFLDLISTLPECIIEAIRDDVKRSCMKDEGHLDAYCVFVLCEWELQQRNYED